ncbi:MAG: nucleoside-diphosphate kinase [Verrucomicrobia bacterium]|nr:nucleoside-diphosphate kinase [Verrucomicrobiota bacterium]
MAKELAFVLINPYTIAKSRTGGVIARCMGRTDLDFVAARMFGPSSELVTQFAELLRKGDETREPWDLIADYVLNAYGPDAQTGKPRRVMLLLFEGEDAIKKIWSVTGSATLRRGSGETIRDTYGDYIQDSQNKVVYFEPAVLVAPTKTLVESTLKLWAKFSRKDGGIVRTATDLPADANVEETLVMLKPDNFRFPSFRPGSIIDLLSSSGLRIIGVKKFHMTVAQAEQFYGPVKDSLREKFKDIGVRRASDALSREFGFDAPVDAVKELCAQLAPVFADSQFESIVKFMTGFKPSDCSGAEKKKRGSESCLALVYQGVDAVQKIRNIVGQTDPRKAKPGSVRREFGSDIMVNAAHASDSPDNAKRELGIIDVEEDSIGEVVEEYFSK